ncbi:Response regulator receiver domain-containing protein [Selenomonas ruminantium]|uniref:Response regulator receiver domain-containing protein n=1 Tax=Selenomonas ruminantium TaxID=971 RepID=A0A1M6S000_SELRU|nr:response regulator [Selenomonas ruminantium]SHK37918.1 Response regulator receiver domain-containing protein [Selenomonas ruminantium]
MKNEILIFSQGTSFILGSIEGLLKKENLEVRYSKLEMEHIAGITKEQTLLVLFYANEQVKDDIQVLSCLADKCDKEGIFFCVIGYPDELEVVERQVDMASIAAEFSRPFEVPDVARQIADLALKRSALKTGSALRQASPVEAKHHLLLCDDDVMFLKMVQQWLGDKYQVTAVKTGMMAVSIAAKSQPELILLDYDMPVMPGTQVLEELRKEEKTAGIPVVFLTGHSDRASVMDAMHLKPQGYLLKSVTREDLVALLEHFFASGQWKNG